MKTTAALALAVLLAVAANVRAGEVTIKNVHLCCGACIKDVNKALTGVDGVSDVAADRAAKTVSYQAADDNAAQAGVDALAKAGFHGTATHGDKEVAFPASGAKKGDKADEVTLTGIHLCCGGCVKEAQKAAQGAAEGATVAVDRESNSVTVKGENIDVATVVAALNNSGFHATVKK